MGLEQYTHHIHGDRSRTRNEPRTNLFTENSQSNPEGSNARQVPRDSKPFVVKRKAGRKRRGESMGRYPFLTWANRYLKARGKTNSEATRKELERRYRRMEKDLKMLVKEGEVSSANPEKMSADDIHAYVAFQKSKKMKEKAIKHNLTALNNLLNLVGNPAVQQFKAKFPSAVPKQRNIRLPTLNERDYQRILETARTVNEFDWTRLEAYTLVILAICTGMRNKEIRLSQIDDIDTVNWIFRVEHVKGEGTYGQSRMVDIRPDAWEIVTKYIRVREKMVERRCPGNRALFPALQDSGDGFFASNSIQKLKSLVEAETGIRFDLRTCRRTYGQMAVDKGLNLDSVSVLMGHSNTKTTENYYCRKRQDVAIREAKEVFGAQNSYPDAKNLKIESVRWDPGYV